MAKKQSPRQKAHQAFIKSFMKAHHAKGKTPKQIQALMRAANKAWKQSAAYRRFEAGAKTGSKKPAKHGAKKHGAKKSGKKAAKKSAHRGGKAARKAGKAKYDRFVAAYVAKGGTRKQATRIWKAQKKAKKG